MSDSAYLSLSKSQKRTIERALVMDQGYVLDFSNKTIQIFFEDSFRIDFYSEKYAANGDSKAKRLRTILALENTSSVVRILQRLWQYRVTLPDFYRLPDPDEERQLGIDFSKIIEFLEGRDQTPKLLDALERFDQSETLDSIINSIERDIRDDRYSAAIDRLHTYCQRRFRLLLEAHGETVSDNDPLHSRVGKYANILLSEGVSEISVKILKSSISIFEQLNKARNNHSLAHDNELLERQEARLVLETVGAILRFLKAIRSDFS